MHDLNYGMKMLPLFCVVGSYSDINRRQSFVLLKTDNMMV